MKEELLIKYLLEETSAEERVQVTHWLGESDENQKEFNRFKQIWDSSKVLSADKKQDPEKAWEKFKTLRDLQDEKKVRSIRRPYTWLKVAAVMLMALTATWFYMDHQKAYNVLSAVQEVSKETLPDGSKLVLNKNTTINYADFKGSKRTISLEKGEVFCDVVPDKSRPFTVRANDVSITVLGTSFNVKHNEHFTEVIVKTGRVSVSRNGRAVLLVPGEKVRIPANSSQWDKTVNQDQLHLYY
ncbi:MAG: iron dicitrate transport regulator FecR, partial [Pedobacter sp.]